MLLSPHFAFKRALLKAFSNSGALKTWATHLLAWPCNKPFSVPNSSALLLFALNVHWAHGLGNVYCHGSMALEVVDRDKSGGNSCIAGGPSYSGIAQCQRQAWSRPTTDIDLGYWYVLLWLHSLPPEACTAVESGDKCQVSGMPVHSWRD